MEIQEFVKQFAEQFDETDATEIQSDTVFKDLDEWSSLTALSIIAMVDDEYGVKITGDNIKSATTVNDLFVIVNELK
jgi:acyl carrier protein